MLAHMSPVDAKADEESFHLSIFLVEDINEVRSAESAGTISVRVRQSRQSQ